MTVSVSSRGAMGWSAVRDCGTNLLFSITFFNGYINMYICLVSDIKSSI